jgi:FkbM family methyltransferase
MEIKIINRIYKNFKFRIEIFKNTPDYIIQKWKYGIYKSLKPYINLRICVRIKNNVFVHLGYDPVDDFILEHLLGKDSQRYFPEKLSLSDKDIVLDVGSHHGIYASILSKRYKGTKIICVEPDPNSIRFIEKHQKVNKLNFDIIPCAISDKSKDGYLVDNNDGSWGKTVEINPTENSILIQTRSLAEILKDVEIGKIRLIKSNCEGGEYTLIDQMIDLELKPNYIILMIHPDKGNVTELVGRLVDYGYDYSIAWESEVNPCYHFFLS